MNTIRVSLAQSTDIDALAQLFDDYRCFYNKASDRASAKQFLQERFSRSESTVFIAHEGLEAVGFTQLYPSFSSVSMARVYILNDLFVAADHRRKGVATELLRAATDFAKAQGAVRVSLNTDIRNLQAQQTYEALGWKRDQEFYAYHFRH